MKTEKDLLESIRIGVEKEPTLADALRRIEIKVENGTVILVGRIDTHHHHQHLLHFISGFTDFKVFTDITVEPDMAASSADDDLKNTVIGALENAGLGQPEVEIKVSRGRVFLEGKVLSEEDRAKIYRFVERIFGVRAICNNLTFSRLNMRYPRPQKA